MTYQDYLDNWHDHYGDDDTGEYGYYRYGKHFPYTVHRLSEEEYNLHIKSVDECGERFEEARLRKDGDEMDRLLAESFPHELELLL